MLQEKKELEDIQMSIVDQMKANSAAAAARAKEKQNDEEVKTPSRPQYAEDL